MSDHCCSVEPPPKAGFDPRYRRILWISLVLNAAMFAVEIGASLSSGSASLLADAVDFAGDAANYGLSLAVLSMSLAWRARAALIKGASMAAYGTLVLARVGYGAWTGALPEPATMGVVALLALAVNVGVAVALYAYRSGDSNMRAVWLCSRNDAIGNIAVMFAALGVLEMGSAWPDLAVAAGMALLGLVSARSVIIHARSELVHTHAHAH